MFNRQDAMRLVTELMAVSATTAPKAVGKDFVQTRILSDSQEIGRLADAMLDYGKTSGKKDFDRDGENVRNSSAVLLLSLKDPKTVGLNCGACGESKCEALKPREGSEFKGPLCAWRLLDLGIALGSAVKTASMFNVDNRIMYRIGVVARKLGLIEGEIAVGIPISATGKNIYFDR